MERLAAIKLTEDGHVVEFPDVPNQPGWDLMVDGQPFQVKCLSDSSLLREHFEKYPDVPVLANSDLIGDRNRWPDEWRQQVFFIEGCSNELIEGQVRRSVEEAKDLGDTDTCVFQTKAATDSTAKLPPWQVARDRLWSVRRGIANR